MRSCDLTSVSGFMSLCENVSLACYYLQLDCAPIPQVTSNNKSTNIAASPEEMLLILCHPTPCRHGDGRSLAFWRVGGANQDRAMLTEPLRRRRGAFNGFLSLQILFPAASGADPCAWGCGCDWQALIEDSETITSADSLKSSFTS